MTYKEIYFLVEGPDDKRFIEAIVKPGISRQYHCIPYEYSGKPPKTVRSLINSIEAMNFADYFFLRDMNRSRCITARKQTIKNKYGRRISVDRIIVVVKEIESWYIAGLDNGACKELGLHSFTSADNITKEKFNDMMPKKFDSRIDFMVEILKRFSVETAVRKNKSFDYFARRTGLV